MGELPVFGLKLLASGSDLLGDVGLEWEREHDVPDIDGQHHTA